MASLSFHFDRSKFEAAFEKFDVVPVSGVLSSPAVEPIYAYRALRRSNAASFIFESSSPEPGASRYAYVCTSVEVVLRTGANESAGDVDPIKAVRDQFKHRSVAPLDSLPALVTGAFGYIGYEAVKHFEPSVGMLPEDPTNSPQSAMIFPRELLVFDRELDQLHIVVFANQAEEFESAKSRIRDIYLALEELIVTPDRVVDQTVDIQTIPSNETDFQNMVRAARESIINGELIQVVLGQRIQTRTNADALDIYEQLSVTNPSPYMYLLDLGDMQLIGASPELMLRSSNGVASIHPIAGTRPRGATTEEDLQHEADLLSNEKESAEHVMLVDLARNDLGRVSRPGTVKVTSLKHVEHYSHVMHLVSRVEGQLADDKDGIDAFQAGFPIGTLAGAPKIRSIQLIAELEPEGRGPYCGAIGWFAPNGDVDTGTVIRSIVLRDGTAHVQGGAGIVFDSDPESENLESLQKTKAPLLAIARAEAVQSQGWRSHEQTQTETPQPATMLLSGD